MRLAIAAALFTLIVSLGGVGYWQIKRLEKTVESLNKKNAVLEIRVAQERLNTDTALKAAEEAKDILISFNQRLNDLAEADRVAQEDRSRIDEILASHDLRKLVKERPTLLQRRINDATDRSIGMLECASRIADTNCDSKSRETKASTSE